MQAQSAFVCERFLTLKRLGSAEEERKRQRAALRLWEVTISTVYGSILEIILQREPIASSREHKMKEANKKKTQLIASACCF